MSETLSFTEVAHLVPAWLEAESGYATAKYGTDNNPQQTALKRGLYPGGVAYDEMHMYFNRAFNQYFKYSDNEETPLLRASQALGKFVNCGRSLLRILIQEDQQLTLAEAQEITTTKVSERCLDMVEPPYNISEVDPVILWQTVFPPAISRVASEISPSGKQQYLVNAIKYAGDLLVKQAEVFAAFGAETGVIAQPGLNSSDDVKAWDVLTV